MAQGFLDDVCELLRPDERCRILLPGLDVVVSEHPNAASAYLRIPLIVITGPGIVIIQSWTPEMAYVLGVLATDGCLVGPVVQARTGYRSAPYLSLTQKEPELLEKVLKLMEC